MPTKKSRPTKSLPKRIIPTLDFDVQTDEEYDMIIGDEGVQEIILNHAIDGINYAVNNKLPDVDVFLVEGERTVFNLKRDQFKHVIKKAQTFFSQKDEYEKCIDLEIISKNI